MSTIGDFIHILNLWNVLILLLTVAICSFTAYCFKIYNIHRKYDHIPGPPRENFFTGNMNEFVRERKKNNAFFEEVMLKWTKQYGHTFVISAFGEVFVVTSDPASVKDLLVTGHHPKSKAVNDPIGYLWGERFIGNGLVTETDHKRWAFRRAKMNPCFMKSYLMKLTADFNTGADVLIRKLAEMADGKTKIRLLDMFHKATLDILGKLAFGLDIDSLETKDSPFTKSIFLAFKSFSEKENNSAFFCLNPSNWKLIWETRKALRFLRKFGKKIMQERLDAQQRGDYVPDDILTQLIKIKEENVENDIEVLLDDFVTFFVAGQETTGNLLGSLVELICRNPKVMQRLKQEVDDIVGEKAVIEYSDLERLVYLDMVVKETLRLAPPIPSTARTVAKDHVIGGYKVPKGTNVLLSTFVTSRLPEYFDNPEKFDPERFSSDVKKRHDTYTYYPFTLGPRTCIGKNFADMEAKIIMTKLIQRFDFDLDQSEPFKIEEITTLRAKGGALCTLKMRDSKY